MQAMMKMAAHERASLAQTLGVSDQYLYQCLTGRRLMRPEDAVRIEKASGGRVRRWDVRHEDWHRIWPELVGRKGAPTVPAEEAANA